MVLILLSVTAIFCSIGSIQSDEPQQHVHHHRVTGAHSPHVHRYTMQQPGEGNGGPVIQGNGELTFQGNAEFTVQGSGGQTIQGGTGQTIQSGTEQTIQGGTDQTIQGGAGPSVQNAPQNNLHYHRVTGKSVTRVHRYTIPGTHHKHSIKKPLSEKPKSPRSSYDVTEQKPAGSSSYDVYEERPGSSYDVYEETDGSSSYDIYEETRGPSSYYSSDTTTEITRGTGYDSSEEITEITDGGSSYDVDEETRRARNEGDVKGKTEGGAPNGGIGCNRENRESTKNIISDAGAGPAGGIVKGFGNAAGHLAQGKMNEIAYVGADAACGFGKMANAATDALKTGDIAGGIGKVGQAFASGVGHAGEDFASQATGAIGKAANDVMGAFGR